MLRHLLFSVASCPCAIPLVSTRVVLPMVQLGPVPDSCTRAAGSLDLHGQIIPVFSVRSFFSLPVSRPRLSDRLIVAQAGSALIALWADETHVSGQVTAAPAAGADEGEPIAPGVERLKDGTFLFTDLARFLASGEPVRIRPGTDHSSTGACR